MDLRSEITTNMQTMGMEVDLHHHEVASPGQCEIGIKYGSADDCWRSRPPCTSTRSRTPAYQHGKTATFMPKPMFFDNGSGMHNHMLDLEGRKEHLSPATSTRSCRRNALWAIGGILKHGKLDPGLHQPQR